MKFRHSLILAALAIAFVNQVSNAEVRLPGIFSDHMVLQRNSQVEFYGWANPFENITVTTSWDSKTYELKGDSYANWQVMLPTPEAGGPYEITIEGSNTITLKDVLIGEVWIASGQSNMQWSANHGFDSADYEVQQANHPRLRFFQVGLQTAEYPQQDLKGEWAVCSPESMSDFSAVAYFFGRELQTNMDIPIGLINSSWGGTPAETWIPKQSFDQDEELLKASEKINPMPWCPEKPSIVYNAMIAPLSRFKIKGSIWYQGETNTANHDSYQHIMTQLIESWRGVFGKEMPFYYVQIAPFKYESPEVGVRVREAQLKTLSVENTGMVVTSDIGNIDDIHPGNKQDVGKRLAHWAMAKTYGHKSVPYSGPLYSRMEIRGEEVYVFFNYTTGGLKSSSGPLTHFEIAGEDKVFYPANANIIGTIVVVSSPNVPKPVAVRFAWGNTAEPNLFNGANLPASSFRSDDWEILATTNDK